MKKIFIILITFLFLIPIVNASPGRLVSSSITTCNGITYGYHSSDKHWHVAVQNSDGSYNASGDIIGYSNPCQGISSYSSGDSQTSTSTDEQTVTSSDVQTTTSTDEESITSSDEQLSTDEQTSSSSDEQTVTSSDDEIITSTDEKIESSVNKEIDIDEANSGFGFILLFPLTILNYFYFRNRNTKLSLINKINLKNFKSKFVISLIYFLYFIFILPTLYDLIILIIDQTKNPSKKLFK